MHDDAVATLAQTEGTETGGLDLLDLAIMFAERWRLLVFGTLLAGLITAGITLLITPTFTARTTFLPPQPQQSTATAALASLGNLAGLAGAVGAGLRTPADQYISLMQSVTVADRIIDQYKLMEVYGVELRMNARKVLTNRVQMTAGKRDGLITVEVDDHSPQRAAEMANSYVSELRRLTEQLALTESQQRRVFFEQQLNLTKQKLTAAQQALLASGYTEDALKAEPKAAADSFARLRAELTATEVRLQSLRSQLLDSTPEVQQQAAAVSALRAKVAALEQSASTGAGPDYIGKYREFKYQETLFDLFARQYEIARVDESREGVPVQVVDVAQPPELKSKPARTLTTLAAMLVALVLLLIFVSARHSWQRFRHDPANARRLAHLRRA